MDIKGSNVIKGIQMDGLRVVGDPQDLSNKYFEDGADEILFIDIVASLYGTATIHELVSKVASSAFIPLTVVGGIRNIHDARKAISFGADKIGINTAAVKDPKFIREIAETFGSQAVVINIEAKMTGLDSWEVYTESGRQRTGIAVTDWVKKVQDLGAGEILLTSVDRDGTGKGPDLDLAQKVQSICSIPVIVSGGINSTDDCSAIAALGLDGVAIGRNLHNNQLQISRLKQELLQSHEIRI